MTALMPCGPRRYAGASARIAVPKALPPKFRDMFREVVAVESANRGQGEADTLLFNICAEADRTRTSLFLHVEPGEGVERLRLARWYAAHGFLPIQAEPLLMTRVAV